MDIAAMSVVMSHNQTKTDASLAIMNQTKNLVEQQGQQLVDMLKQSTTSTDHPSLGSTIDLKV